MLGWELPPHHVGGMGVACEQLCINLAKSGVDIEFVLPFDADFSNIDYMKVISASSSGPNQLFRDFGNIYSSSKMGTKNNNLSANTSADVILSNYVKELVSLGEYDLIHAHDWLTFRAGLAAKQVSGKPLILHVHATEFDRAGRNYGNPFVREIEYIGFQLADRIIAVSQATKQTIIDQYGISESKIDVAHNAYHFDPYTRLDTDNVYKYIKLLKNNGYQIVLSAGRLTIQKGLTHLMRADKQVVSVRPKTIFLFVGSGDQYNELTQLSAELEIAQNVIMVGQLNGTGQPWRDSFRIADVFVMPSVSEPFGLTPLEALSFGVPVIISKQSGVSEVLNNCLKVDFWDENEMANKLIAVLRDLPLKNLLAENGMNELKNITWKNSVETILNVYKNNLIGKSA